MIFSIQNKSHLKISRLLNSYTDYNTVLVVVSDDGVFQKIFTTVQSFVWLMMPRLEHDLILIHKSESFVFLLNIKLVHLTSMVLNDHGQGNCWCSKSERVVVNGQVVIWFAQVLVWSWSMHRERN